MAPAPAGPPSVPSPLARLLLGVVGETARMEGLQGARGHCNPPHNELGYDDGRFFCPAAGPPTPQQIQSRFVRAWICWGGLCCLQL